VLLGPNDLEQSNSIRFNGRLLEDVLAGVQVSGNCCPSCSELVGRDVTCRTIVYQGSQYESVPEELIWKAACKVGGCACVAEAERCC
jgi:hypothetical protein